MTLGQFKGHCFTCAYDCKHHIKILFFILDFNQILSYPFELGNINLFDLFFIFCLLFHILTTVVAILYRVVAEDTSHIKYTFE